MDYQSPNHSRQTQIVLPQVGEQSTVKNFMANVFTFMFIALGISALIAYVFANNQEWMNVLTGNKILFYSVIFAPLGFVLLMSFGYGKLSAPVLVTLFILYSAINGITFSFILLQYKIGSVIGCFISASAMFGVMAFMGYTTKKDLTSFGRIMFMGLIGIIIASLINIFLGSSTMDYIISFIGVMVFTGLTAYDVQKLKRIGEGIEMEGTPAVEVRKRSIMGALTLYLDFINLFLMLLRLFGGRRD